MINLYRGIIDILLQQCKAMDEKFCNHIRGNVSKESIDGDQLGLTGFWNLLLEITFVLFTKLAFLFGISIVAAFTLIFFPLNAIWWGITSTMYLNRKEMVQYTFIEPSHYDNQTQEKK
jgi:hypothetical protein